MADRYHGPATLRTDDGLTIDTTVRLTTNDSDGTWSWDGPATTTDLRALGARAKSATLVLPGGREGTVHVAAVDTDQLGVTLRLHGSGPMPY